MQEIHYTYKTENKPTKSKGQYRLILYNNIFRIESNAHASISNKGVILGGAKFTPQTEGQLKRRFQPKPRGGDRKSAQFKQQGEIK